MGTEYYLADHSTKTLFELGKGSWRWILDDNGRLLPWKDLDENLKKAGYDDPEYRALVVKRLVDYGMTKKLELVNDSDDSHSDLRYEKGYDVVASRYSDFNFDDDKRHTDECRDMRKKFFDKK